MCYVSALRCGGPPFEAGCLFENRLLSCVMLCLFDVLCLFVFVLLCGGPPFEANAALLHPQLEVVCKMATVQKTEND